MIDFSVVIVIIALFVLCLWIGYLVKWFVEWIWGIL
jgi:hypothetical protein